MRTTSGIAGMNNRTTKNNFVRGRKGGGFARHGVNKEGVSFSSTRTNANAGVSVFFPSSIQTTTREEVKDIVMKEKVEKENKGQAILDVCKKQSSMHVFTVAATTMVDKKWSR